MYSKRNLQDVPLMAPEFSSLIGGGEFDMRGIESIQVISAENLAEDNIRANLKGEIDTVIENVQCIVERMGCISSIDEKESF